MNFRCIRSPWGLAVLLVVTSYSLMCICWMEALTCVVHESYHDKRHGDDASSNSQPLLCCNLAIHTLHLTINFWQTLHRIHSSIQHILRLTSGAHCSQSLRLNKRKIQFGWDWWQEASVCHAGWQWQHNRSPWYHTLSVKFEISVRNQKHPHVNG